MYALYLAKRAIEKLNLQTKRFKIITGTFLHTNGIEMDEINYLG